MTLAFDDVAMYGTPMAAKIGRPSVTQRGDAAGTKITVRVSEREHTALSKRAAQLGETVAGRMRSLALEDASYRAPTQLIHLAIDPDSRRPAACGERGRKSKFRSAVTCAACLAESR